MRRDLLALPGSEQGGSFSLVKLYADCVASEGEAAIIYAGCVAWHGLELSISGSSFFDRQGEGRESWALSCGSAMIENENLRWSQGDSHFEARVTAKGFGHQLYSGEAGGVAFECVAPECAVRVTNGTRSLEGRGYVERLELTIPPWTLPLDSLRWGRFATAERQLVWVEWQGAHPLVRVFVNGTLHDGASIHGDRIQLTEDTALVLGESRILRSGRLDGMGGVVREIVRSMPGIGSIHETKRLRMGTFEERGRSVAAGWVIDEEVYLR